MKKIDKDLHNSRLNSSSNEFDLSSPQDLLAEEILENMSSTPLGLVLKKIASLPEVRQKKVLDLRQRISTGAYNEDSYLDEVLDKVLSDF